MSQVTVSVVIISHNEGKHLARTVEGILTHMPANGEIIVVDDHSTDSSANGVAGIGQNVTLLRPVRRLGASIARNLGARRARGPIIVFSDAHIDVAACWAEPLIAALQRSNTGAVGPIIADMYDRKTKGYGFRFIDAGLNTEWLGCRARDTYPVPLLGAGFMAMRRDVFQALGGFDAGMLWGMEDLEMCVRLWTLGYTCLLTPAVEVGHLDRWGMNPDYQCDWEEGLHNTLRLAILHFGQKRIRRVFEHYATDPMFCASLSRLAAGNSWEMRRHLHAIRPFDDDWYFRKFQMEI